MHRWRRGHRDGAGTRLSGLLPAPGDLLLFVAAVAVLNATPGADLLLAVSRTLQSGARAGVAASLGIGAGCLVHAVAAGLGLAALLAVHPAAFRLLQWLGAAYLAWLGWGLLRDAWRGRRAAGADSAPRAAVSFGADFRRGLLTNVLNPKVAFFFLAFLPPFVPANAADRTLSFLALGVWFTVQGTLFLFGIVAMAARLARWHTGASSQRILSGIGGVLFIGLALRLLAARQAPA